MQGRQRGIFALHALHALRVAVHLRRHSPDGFILLAVAAVTYQPQRARSISSVSNRGRRAGKISVRHRASRSREFPPKRADSDTTLDALLLPLAANMLRNQPLQTSNLVLWSLTLNENRSNRIVALLSVGTDQAVAAMRLRLFGNRKLSRFPDRIRQREIGLLISPYVKLQRSFSSALIHSLVHGVHSANSMIRTPNTSNHVPCFGSNLDNANCIAS